MSRRWMASFYTKVKDCEGNLKHENIWLRPNLRTNDGIDWQSAMGGGPAESSAQLSGTATAASATTLTNTGAAFPTSGGYGNSASSPLAGKIVVCGPNSSGTGSSVWGVILSHTATVLTVDRWYQPGNPGGSAGTTPNATATYQIITAVLPTWWMALTTTAITPAAADHTLSGELTTNGFARALAGWTHTNGTNTFTLNNLYTCSGGTGTTINGEAVFNAQNGGIMTFEAVEPQPPVMNSGDTLSESVVVTY